MRSWMTIYLNTTTCKEKRSQSDLAFPKAQRRMEQATDNIHQKKYRGAGWKAGRKLDTRLPAQHRFTN